MSFIEALSIKAFHLCAWVIVLTVALGSYIVIGVLYLGLPVFALGVFLKYLWTKLSFKLEYYLGKSKVN